MKRLFKGEAHRPTGYGIFVLGEMLICLRYAVYYHLSDQYKQLPAC
ncbi:MAG: hypothetical protein LBJ00_14020 [Planctomycetaceae bacterium]|nr:hypothetical protein [Planctomycetaceae bacterium]